MFFVFVCILGCGVRQEEASPLQFFDVQEGAYAKYVNNYSMPNEPNLTLDKTIYNNDYPIEIAIYKDGKFYYNLPTLDDGHGTWKEVNGKLELFARRKLFDMFIEIHPNDQEVKNVKIKFSDRFGPKILNMNNSNIQ